MNKFYGVAAMIVVAGSVSACTYQVPVTAAPNLNVYSSYSSKLPGRYLLYVDADAFTQDVKATGAACSFHTYPVDARAAFKQAVRQTLEQLVEHVELVEQPVPSDSLQKSGDSGMIVVKGDSIQARFVMIPGFWSASAQANVDLSAAISVDGASGRLFGTEASGSGNAQGPAGGMCSGPERVIADATSSAMKQLLGQLGERMSNSPRLRAMEASK